mmetsp:Transcript_8493/g.21440  ORF Transcript_8493/g.21440 Transcript_8493/m.21440 type:complete len:341 (+) Transcript_8493:66-1088(+)
MAMEPIDIDHLDDEPISAAPELISLRAVLKGHNGWVTCLATPPEDTSVLLSGSRDKTIIIWNLTREHGSYGVPRKSLQGHAHFVSDVQVSSDGQFALSGSWDGSLRLWDLSTGETTRRFVGHKKDVLSVAFSSDNRQIVSGSRDRTIKLWNTLGQCKYTIDGEGSHSEWVSCVRFSPNTANPLIVSAGWDKMVKVWTLAQCQLSTNLEGHTGTINCVTVSPDGSLCASGGKDNTAMLWDLNESKNLYSLDAGGEVNCLVFSPNRYWLCAGTSTGIRIWDLETKSVVTELNRHRYPEFFLESEVDVVGKGKDPACISLVWSPDGNTLFAGYTDSCIRVWVV